MDGLISILLSLVCLVLILLRLRDRKRIRGLREQAEDFLNHGGKPLDVALGEDELAMLQNTLCELQDRLVRARQLHKEECSRTSSLTSDISHQLKTPLTTLRLYTELDAAPHMQASLVQITRMETLIGSLLRLERLCADGYAFSFRTTDLRLLAQAQWGNISASYADRELILSGEASARCDEKWLGEAFLNLLKNACEHTSSGGKIWVTLEKNEASVFCTIEDDGGGVSEKELPRLFERFYRTEHQSRQGAGIGLSIVREVIRRHHGTIAASNSDKGLKMEITLPCLEETTNQAVQDNQDSVRQKTAPESC